MATKELTTSILKRLEEGTAEIWSRYRNMIAASEAKYNRELRDLESDYTAAANRAAASARIDLNNTLEKMADSGYIRTGETVHATLSANAAKANALATLAAQKAKNQAALQAASAEEEAKLNDSAQKETSEFRNTMLETLRDQQNADREYQAKAQQQAFENRITQEKLALEQAKYAAQMAAVQGSSGTSATSGSSKSQNEGLVPEKSAYDYLKAIVEQNTKTNKKNTTVVDKTAIYRAVYSILQNTNLSRQYRYEMYLYAKSLGYIPEN